MKTQKPKKKPFNKIIIIGYCTPVGGVIVFSF